MTHPAEGTYPHVPAAFINAIAEEGTKAEAVEWLQKLWNENCALRSQGGKASMTSANLAALIHEARFPEGKDAPNYIPFLHEDRSGREYCLRIARKIIEAIELAPTPSPAESAAVAAERERCAKLCDIWVARYGSGDIQYITPTEFASDAVKDIADAIRRGVNAPALPREESNG